MNGTSERLPQEITPNEFMHEQHPGLHFDKYQFDDRKNFSRRGNCASRNSHKRASWDANFPRADTAAESLARTNGRTTKRN